METITNNYTLTDSQKQSNMQTEMQTWLKYMVPIFLVPNAQSADKIRSGDLTPAVLTPTCGQNGDITLPARGSPTLSAGMGTKSEVAS